MTADQVRDLLRKKIGTGTNADFARSLGVSRAYIGDVRKGKREPGPAILDALDLVRCVTIEYVPTRKAKR